MNTLSRSAFTIDGFVPLSFVQTELKYLFNMLVRCSSLDTVFCDCSSRSTPTPFHKSVFYLQSWKTARVITFNNLLFSSEFIVAYEELTSITDWLYGKLLQLKNLLAASYADAIGSVCELLLVEYQEANKWSSGICQLIFSLVDMTSRDTFFQGTYVNCSFKISQNAYHKESTSRFTVSILYQSTAVKNWAMAP